MDSAVPRSLLPDTAVIDGRGRLSVGGVDLLDVASEHGTPLFVYDETHLRARCREALAAFGDGVAYASKAFLCLAMARLVHEEGLYLDVATGGELHVAVAAGVPPDRLVVHGNNKSDDELVDAINIGVHRIVIDSFDELFTERYDAILTPPALGTAPKGLGATGDPVFCVLWTLLGMPAVTLPLMHGANGLPLGVQLVGRRNFDARLLRTARWLERKLA